jgi:hypothetical protein
MQLLLLAFAYTTSLVYFPRGDMDIPKPTTYARRGSKMDSLPSEGIKLGFSHWYVTSDEP